MLGKIVYIDELIEMRKKYSKKPIMNMTLQKPDWLVDKKDAMNEIYDNTTSFFSNASINYGYILQANTLLFSKDNNYDCPANILTTDSDYVNENPRILYDMAQEIYRYKDTEIFFVPDHLKNIVECIQKETDRKSFSTQIVFKDGHVGNIYMLSVMVMRKYIPNGYLDRSLYPLLTNFNAGRTAMILPEQYWTRKAKKLL